MSEEIVTLRPFVAARNPIFCKPLNLRFPQIYRLHRSRRIPPDQTPAASGDWSLRSHAKFSLSGEVAPHAEIVCVEPIGHLTLSDQKSLVLRHHWSRAMAQAYLQGVEDVEPDQPIGGVFVSGDAFFTLTQRATSKAWNGPMIFYLADLFEDDGLMGAQSWEMSASCDGVIQRTDVFYDGQ